LIAIHFEMARTPLYTIVTADWAQKSAIAETLDFGSHLPLCHWLVDHAEEFGTLLALGK
jgi:hypothetical protein